MISTEEQVAEILLDIRAVHFNEETPFIFTSSTASPVYVDCRKLISYPRQRTLITALSANLIYQKLGKGLINVVAGGETAGIPYAAWLASELNLPMIYVRKAHKGFGRGAQIEGELHEQASVILVEDLLFDAQSKVNFCSAIRNAGGDIKHTLVVFDYGNTTSRENLARVGVELHALTNWSALLSVGLRGGYFSEQQALVIRDFLQDPAAWRASRELAE